MLPSVENSAVVLSRTGLITAVLAGALCFVTACSDGPVVLRSQADRHISAPSNPDDPAAAQCQRLRDQVHADRESVREAPTTSTSPEIVAAAQGQADKRIDDLQERMDTLGCNDQQSADAPRDTPLPPMQPAPNAPNR
jgi:hypothetical protein